MNYKYYIWDIGGTLFDTLSTSVRAFQQTLAIFQLSASDEAIYEQLKKTSTGEAAKFFVGNLAEDFLQKYHEIERPMQENPLSFQDTAEVLKSVVEKGGKNYIISHRDLQVVDFLENAHLIEYFSYVITSNDHFARKPNPESVDYLVDRFGVEREKALMIGDRELDILAAKNANVKAVLFSPDGFLQVPEADFTVKSLSEVLKIE
ncbi:haloacid dehalogenase superfamily, subfamily IA, variant 1 with third motif having Dx(3-4)D or Dx(3-4)E [Pilibacter termitis]|uniref:Haloacid dehalogenase superfamily, subfamily IA, variant 1 with third motif having Dx(3-4)D or Dx(3-4)E n=2 Tax=Pilibacter termitis TaxID=263852 RepID=A0A1T4Q9J4_9ENTE|nr:haloacid dehalogenase superfamily, subfamily IA, variant 1 with third motif having Dx(3-4)D or Dx(3-4)E [Pilibacter termitis]